MEKFDDYQENAKLTAVFNPIHGLEYLTLGLCGEAGEAANKVKKIFRDENYKVSEEKAREIALELGDTLWYLAMLAEHLGYSLSQIAEMNAKKLAARKTTDSLRGSGDNR